MRIVGSTGGAKVVKRVQSALEVGPALVSALADGDWERVASLLHPDLHLRGLTPGKFNEATGPEAVYQAIEIYKLWFYEGSDYLTGILACEARPDGPDGQYKLSYSFSAKSPHMSQWHNDQGFEPVPPDADWRVEQEAYYRVRDDRISWMIILCDGYHRGPISDDTPGDGTRGGKVSPATKSDSVDPGPVEDPD